MMATNVHLVKNYMTLKTASTIGIEDDYVLSFLNLLFSHFLRFGLGGRQFGIDRFVTSCQVVSVQNSFTQEALQMQRDRATRQNTSYRT